MKALSFWEILWDIYPDKNFWAVHRSILPHILQSTAATPT